MDVRGIQCLKANEVEAVLTSLASLKRRKMPSYF